MCKLGELACRTEDHCSMAVMRSRSVAQTKYVVKLSVRVKRDTAGSPFRGYS